MGRNEKQKGTQIQFTIPGDNNEHEGKMKWIVLNECLYIGYIDIWSRYLPDSVFRSPSFRKQGTVPFKINYCFKGRCEVGLISGTTTFVTGDEIALDCYSGVGTIGIIASPHVKEVISVELNKDAVKDADTGELKLVEYTCPNCGGTLYSVEESVNGFCSLTCREIRVFAKHARYILKGNVQLCA